MEKKSLVYLDICPAVRHGGLVTMLEKAKDTNSKIPGEKLHKSHLNIFNVSLWPWERSCCYLSPSLWWQTQSGCQSSSSDEFIKACWMQSIDWQYFIWLMADEGAERGLLKKGSKISIDPFTYQSSRQIQSHNDKTVYSELWEILMTHC